MLNSDIFMRVHPVAQVDQQDLVHGQAVVVARRTREWNPVRGRADGEAERHRDPDSGAHVIHRCSPDPHIAIPLVMPGSWMNATWWMARLSAGAQGDVAAHSFS